MKNRSLFRKSLLVHSISLALCSFGAYGETFNSSLLVGNSADMDWSNNQLVMTPGTYDLDVYVNNVWRGKFTLTVANDDRGTVHIHKEDATQLSIQELDDAIANAHSDMIDINLFLLDGFFPGISAECSGFSRVLILDTGVFPVYQVFPYPNTRVFPVYHHAKINPTKAVVNNGKHAGNSQLKKRH